MTKLKIVATMFATAALLAACGGGGGGGAPAPSPSPSPPPVADTTPPVLTLTTSSPAALTTNVVVAANETLGGNVSITVQAPDGSTVTGSTVLNPGNQGMTWTNQSGSPLACNTAYKVTASAGDLATPPNVGTLNNGQPVTLSTVGCPALRYTDKVVAVWTEGYPFLVGLNGSSYAVTRLTNQTGKNLGSCGAANKPLSDGKVLFQCTTVGGAFERLTYSADLVAGTLGSFGGTVPSDITFTVTESNSTQPVPGTTSAHVAGGWYYADPNASWRLLFQNDAGGAPIVVKEGTFAADGTIKVIRAYSN